MSLTDGQSKILQFIKNFIQEHGYAPTVREIGKGCFITTSTVHAYLWRLKNKGAIEWQPNIARTIRIVKKGAD